MMVTKFKFGLLSPYDKIRQGTIHQMIESPQSPDQPRRAASTPQLHRQTQTKPDKASPQSSEQYIRIHASTAAATQDEALLCIIIREGLLHVFASSPYYPCLIRTLLSFPENAVSSMADPAAHFFGNDLAPTLLLPSINSL